jgi:tight adherence protein C
MMPIALLAVALLLTGAALIVRRELYIRELNKRVTQAVAGVPGKAQPLQITMAWLSALGTRYRRYYAPENLEQLRIVVQASGFNPHRMVPVLIGSKTISMVAFPLLASIGVQFTDMMLNTKIMVIIMAIAVGIMFPRVILRSMSRRFNKDIERGTPDAIDLLVVCSQAGMGLESALERVAQEMERSNPAISTVFNGLLTDLRVLPDRRDAFTNLGERSTFEGLRRFATMVNQSMQYGTPLSDALRAIAEELRRDRITKLEERAHKLGAKLTIPMVLFLLPAMMIILAGSPFLHLMESMHNIGH